MAVDSEITWRSAEATEAAEATLEAERAKDEDGIIVG